MEDIIKSIKSALYDRVASPLFGAFITSWLAINNKLIIISFSEGDGKSKIEEINNIYANITFEVAKISFSMDEKIIFWLIYPILMTIFYIFVYPNLALPVYRYSLHKNKLLREAKLKNDESRLLTEKESIELNIKLIQMEIKYNGDVAEFQRKISILDNKIK